MCEGDATRASVVTTVEIVSIGNQLRLELSTGCMRQLIIIFEGMDTETEDWMAKAVKERDQPK